MPAPISLIAVGAVVERLRESVRDATEAVDDLAGARVEPAMQLERTLMSALALAELLEFALEADHHDADAMARY